MFLSRRRPRPPRGESRSSSKSRPPKSMTLDRSLERKTPRSSRGPESPRRRQRPRTSSERSRASTSSSFVPPSSTAPAISLV
jgi:hypothetical protein